MTGRENAALSKPPGDIVCLTEGFSRPGSSQLLKTQRRTAGGESGEDVNAGTALWKHCARHCSSQVQLLFLLFKLKKKSFFLCGWGDFFEHIMYLYCIKLACLPVQFIALDQHRLTCCMCTVPFELRTGCFSKMMSCTTH